MQLQIQLEQPQLTQKLQSFWSAHRRLAEFNKGRLMPSLPGPAMRERMAFAAKMQRLELEILEIERKTVKDYAQTAPRNADDFLDWFRELRKSGPGQHDPLFDWLASDATKDEMKWFIQQEVAGEAGFEDLTALTQLQFAPEPKMEMAQNYWDEMGRGKQSAMHGPMLGTVARELDLGDYDIDDIVVEALALANILLGLALHRHYAFHSVGALGVIELTAPDRSKKVAEGLKRLQLSPAGQRYYILHSTIDLKHSQDWEAKVLYPLVKSRPEVACALAEGALMRLRAGERCFERYRRYLWGH